MQVLYINSKESIRDQYFVECILFMVLHFLLTWFDGANFHIISLGICNNHIIKRRSFQHSDPKCVAINISNAHEIETHPTKVDFHVLLQSWTKRLQVNAFQYILRILVFVGILFMQFI